MRPRKRILLISPSELTGSDWKFTLEVLGYSVVVIKHPSEAPGVEAPINLVVASLLFSSYIPQVTAVAKAFRCKTLMLAYDRASLVTASFNYGAQIGLALISMREAVIEMVKIGSRVKRGPVNPVFDSRWEAPELERKSA
jgi:hypothetical protein